MTVSLTHTTAMLVMTSVAGPCVGNADALMYFQAPRYFEPKDKRVVNTNRNFGGTANRNDFLTL